MLNGADFRAIVSGERRGPMAAIARGSLAIAEVPYAAVVRWRNRRFDRGRDVHRVEVPVISVGNLTLGGTGKTPLVEWIARWFRDQGVRVTLVSRGYGAEAGALNDEALELEQKLPDVPHVQNRDRVAAARVAIDELDCQLILLDDGFQHRRIARDLDIVVLDALDPFGCQHVFPRGTLRESASGLARAQIVVLSRADLVTAQVREEIRLQAQHLAPTAAWIEACHVPRVLRSSSGQESSLDALRDQRIAAFCGIGNPPGFRRLLENRGYQIVDFKEFPDHFRYSRADVDSLSRWVQGMNVAAVVTTHKDLVKLRVDQLGGRPLWALVVGLEFLANAQALRAMLEPFVQKVQAAPASGS